MGLTLKNQRDKLAAWKQIKNIGWKIRERLCIRFYIMIWLHGAEGAVAINSQAKGPNFDDTLESNGAPKKWNELNLSGWRDRGVSMTEVCSVVGMSLF